MIGLQLSIALSIHIPAVKSLRGIIMNRSMRRGEFFRAGLGILLGAGATAGIISYDNTRKHAHDHDIDPVPSIPLNLTGHIIAGLSQETAEGMVEILEKQGGESERLAFEHYRKSGHRFDAEHNLAYHNTLDALARFYQSAWVEADNGLTSEADRRRQVNPAGQVLLNPVLTMMGRGNIIDVSPYFQVRIKGHTPMPKQKGQYLIDAQVVSIDRDKDFRIVGEQGIADVQLDTYKNDYSLAGKLRWDIPNPTPIQQQYYHPVIPFGKLEQLHLDK